MKLSSRRTWWPSLAGTTIALFGLLASVPAVVAKPRPPGPPLPEPGLIFSETFDQPLHFAASQMIDGSTWVESWSGYALNRSTRTPVVEPWRVSMLRSNAWNLDPERGAVRLWYKPETASGTGPGKTARLLTLVSTNGTSQSTVWSLLISSDGNTIGLVCPGPDGPAACLTAQVTWQAGDWHLITLAYNETNTALYLDNAQVAAGNGLTPISPEVGQAAALIVGSNPNGQEVAAGEIEELCVFSDHGRFRLLIESDFGIDPGWEILNYWNAIAPVAAMGPVTEAEELAVRERAAARRAERLAAEQAAANSGALSLSSSEGTLGFGTQSLSSTNGFWLLSPQVLETNILLTLVNCDTNIGYDIYYAPVVTTNTSWSILATGVVGQATFLVPLNEWQGYYRGAVGGDWDGDSIPNWMDANPTNSTTGTLGITIDNPSYGTSIN